jgi:rifampin ADP-ribosylating transferase
VVGDLHTNKSKTMTDDLAQLAPRYPSSPPYYHGTRIDLRFGDLIEPGYLTNYGTGKTANHVYFSASLEAAIWGAELARGEGPGRIYVVEPMGPFTDDPNLTDKRFPGNPTKSYRSRRPLRVIGEVTEWQGHSPDAIKAMKDGIARLREQGIEAVDDEGENQ